MVKIQPERATLGLSGTRRGARCGTGAAARRRTAAEAAMPRGAASSPRAEPRRGGGSARCEAGVRRGGPRTARRQRQGATEQRCTPRPPPTRRRPATPLPRHTRDAAGGVALCSAGWTDKGIDLGRRRAVGVPGPAVPHARLQASLQVHLRESAEEATHETHVRAQYTPGNASL